MKTGPYKMKYLPVFTENEKTLLKTSRAALTAIGLNHYGTNLVDAAGNTSNAGKTKMFDNKIPLSYSFESKGIAEAAQLHQGHVPIQSSNLHHREWLQRWCKS